MAGGVRVFIRDDDDLNINSTSPAWTQDKWHHVVGTFDGTTVTAWLDGVAGASDTDNLAAFTNTNLTFGIWNREPPLTASIDGRMRDIRFYNWVLPTNLIDAIRLPQTRWDLYEPIQRPFLAYVAGAPPAGRTTHNTDSHPLGVHTGMGWRYGNP